MTRSERCFKLHLSKDFKFVTLWQNSGSSCFCSKILQRLKWREALVLVLACMFHGSSSAYSHSVRRQIWVSFYSEPQPNTAQLRPDIAFYQSNNRKLKYTNAKLSNLPKYCSLEVQLACFDLKMCTLRVMWLSENHNKEMPLWSLPGFITSPLY